MTTWESKLWEDVEEGEALPTLRMPITLKTMVAAVCGTRDFMPYHHNSEFTKGLGIRDQFVNTMFDQALFGRFTTDWSGPDSDFRKTTLSMVAQICPGDMAVVEGEVTKKERVGDDYLVEVSMAARAEGVGDARHRIGDAGAGGDGRHAYVSGGARVSVGGVRRRLLVARVDDADVLVDAAVVDALDVPAAEGEEHLRALLLHHAGDHVAAVYPAHASPPLPLRPSAEWWRQCSTCSCTRSAISSASNPRISMQTSEVCSPSMGAAPRTSIGVRESRQPGPS